MKTEPIVTGDAARLVAWGAQILAGELGLDADPVQTRRVCRELLAGRAEVPEELLSSTLIAASAAARLEVLPLEVVQSSIHSAPLPVLTCSGGGFAVTRRRADELLVLRPDEEPTWMTGEALFAKLGPGGHGWFTALPAAPLEPLGAHDDEHPSPMRRLLALMHLERDDLRVIFIYAVAVGLLALATPIAVQTLVGTVAFGTLLQPIVVLSLMLLAALSFQAIVRGLQTRVVESVQERAFVRTATDLAWRLPRVRRDAAGEFGPATVNQFFEVMTLQKTASTLLTDGIAAALQIGIGMMVLAFYHPALLAFDLALLAMLLVVVFLPFGRGLRTSIEESYAKYRVAAWLEELAKPGGALRTTGGAAFAAERADGLIRRYLEVRRKHYAVLFGQTLGGLGLQVFASAALLGLGGWLVVQQSLTLGQLVAAELIVAAITSSIAKLGKLLDASYDLLTAVDKLGHLVDLPLETQEPGEPVPGQGGVRVEVHAASDGASRPLDLEVSAGERVALVGAEGHALASWLAARRVPARGSITHNTVETSTSRTPSLREQISFVQHSDFFQGSVLENLTVGRVGVTLSDARAALERVGLLEELRQLPAGLETKLGPDGGPLTPSQLTRLLVARALASSPRLIVVEESLESLEAGARARCVAALTRDDAPWTLIAMVADASAQLAQSCARTMTLSELSAAPIQKVAS